VCGGGEWVKQQWGEPRRGRSDSGRVCWVAPREQGLRQSCGDEGVREVRLPKRLPFQRLRSRTAHFERPFRNFAIAFAASTALIRTVNGCLGAAVRPSGIPILLREVRSYRGDSDRSPSHGDAPFANVGWPFRGRAGPSGNSRMSIEVSIWPIEIGISTPQLASVSPRHHPPRS